MRKLILCFCSFLVWISIGHLVLAQCSNGTVTIKEYSPIAYNAMARMGRIEMDIRATLTIPATGIQGGRPLVSEPEFFDKNGGPGLGFSLFLKPFEEALAQWIVVNETDVEVALPLLVEFRLKGEGIGHSPADDRNLVILKDDKLTIRVLSKSVRAQH